MISRSGLAFEGSGSADDGGVVLCALLAVAAVPAGGAFGVVVCGCEVGGVVVAASCEGHDVVEDVGAGVSADVACVVDAEAGVSEGLHSSNGEG